MTSEIRIRPLTREDVPATHKFMRFILDNDYATGFRPEWHGDIEDLAGSYIENPRQRLFVADDQGQVVGTAAIRHRSPQKWFPGRYDPEHTCELGRVFVAPSHRRRGLALRLAEMARRWAQEQGYRVVSLHTETTNGPAVALWSKLCTRVEPDGEGPADTVFFELPIDQPIV